MTINSVYGKYYNIFSSSLKANKLSQQIPILKPKTDMDIVDISGIGVVK
jgi:hypothetical protein